MDIIFSSFWLRLQSGMFPMFEEALGDANQNHFRVIAALDFIRPENWILDFNYGPGRPKIDREKFFRAFVAKKVLNIPTSVVLIDRLKVDIVLRRICGFIFKKKLPCEPTFSNAFSEFADSAVCEKIHANIIEKNLSDSLVFHISRDSTAIEARESAPAKKTILPKVNKKLGRPKKGEEKKEPTRLELQRGQSVQEMLHGLAGNADYGAKMDSHGNLHTWLGYKLHLDVADGGIPVSCCLTPASVHDSGASKPLQKMTSGRVKSMYCLADKAYDSKEIREDISSYGQVSIIPEKTRRNGDKKDLERFEKRRFKVRSTVERVNSTLKERFGATNIFVKGPKKVMCHLMFGILVLTSEALMRLDRD